MAARHWQAVERSSLGEWVLRASGGFTGRANSVLPLGDPGMPPAGAVDAAQEWYRARGLRPMIQLPMRLDEGAPGGALDALLAARGWQVRPGPAVVMTADSAAVAGRAAAGLSAAAGEIGIAGRDAAAAGIGTAGGNAAGCWGSDARIVLTGEPDRQWLARYRYRGADLPPVARSLLLSAPDQVFASVRRRGATVAIGRLSVADGWGGLTAIEVDPSWRRSGLGTAVTAALAAEASSRGAGRIFLQVEERNGGARALYHRCGFRDRHRYHYRVAPDAS